MKRYTRPHLRWTLTGLLVLLTTASVVSFWWAVGLGAGNWGVAVWAGGVCIDHSDEANQATLYCQWIGDFDLPPLYSLLPSWNTAGNDRFFFLPLWPISLILLVAAGVLWRRTLRQPVHGCTRCGYDLTGNTSGRCPECGKEVTPRKCQSS